MDLPTSLQIQQRLLEFLNRHADVYEELDAATDLIESGILDSLLVTDLVIHVQDAFGVALAARDISPTHFSNLERISELVHGKLVKLNQAA